MGKMKIWLHETDNGFFYGYVGSETHGKPTFKMWANRSLVKRDDKGNPYVEFPINGARLEKTEKGTIVLRPAEGWRVFLIGRECGYRGSSKVVIGRLPDLDKGERMEYFYEYASELGSLGVSEYALYSTTQKELYVEEEATGRLYGADPVFYKKYHWDEDRGFWDAVTLPPDHEAAELLRDIHKKYGGAK